jgi:hypothetical protein
MSECTCFPVDPKYWTTHYGAVDATTLEPNPDCPEHFPRSERIVIWKHDCIKHGMVDDKGERPCDPPCEDPWNVDAPAPHGASFTSHPAATSYVRALLALEGKA